MRREINERRDIKSDDKRVIGITTESEINVVQYMLVDRGTRRTASLLESLMNYGV